MKNDKELPIDFAPLESVTVASFRNIYSSLFPGCRYYYIPFLSALQGGKLGKREEKDIDPRYNDVSNRLPQIISKNATDTLALLHRLKSMGYPAANLNFGCPSGTVVAKGRGGGMLKDLETMDAYLNEVYARTPLPLSIKTRIGYESIEEWGKILEIYARYPIAELIIHPRTVQEGYVGPLHLEALEVAHQKLTCPLLYNGEIKSHQDIDSLSSRFPYLSAFMMGRGLLERPDFFMEKANEEERREALRSYAEQIASSCIERMGWNNASFPIKAIWRLLVHRFAIDPKLEKALFKQKSQDDFFALANQVLDCPLKEEEPSPYLKGTLCDNA